MSFSAKIRLFLILAALLPPLAMTGAIYFFSKDQAEQEMRARAEESARRYASFINIIKEQAAADFEELATSEIIEETVSDISLGLDARLNIDIAQTPFQFIEILDSSGVIRASVTRPGLVGEAIPNFGGFNATEGIYASETIETDHTGRHPSLALIKTGRGYYMYAGIYLDKLREVIISVIPKADPQFVFADGDEELVKILKDPFIEPFFIYEDTLYALLGGSERAGFWLTATFSGKGSPHLFGAMMRTVGAVGLLGIILAIIFGIYITGQAKKEIDNLVEASERISSGDYKTPVMAYEEGEFSRLADAFTDMMLNIRKTRDELAMSEKIAAWQAIGRKVAHEIKNPLTPIEISVDDLRRSAKENLPNLHDTIDSTTSIIKTETGRLRKLLDNFVSFARMAPPEISDTRVGDIIEQINLLYRSEIDSGRLTISNRSEIETVRLDPEKIKQLLINLIKNGLELSPESKVTAAVDVKCNNLAFQISDNGPGFAESILEEGVRPYVSTKKDGSGLGLVICQRIAYDHGGRLEISNRENGGGMVEVTIPVE